MTAFYVTDMTGGDWARPAPGSWIAGAEAWYVVGSSRRGGMGAPETVPFAERMAAEAFSLEYGGSVLAYPDIPTSAVLGQGHASADAR